MEQELVGREVELEDLNKYLNSENLSLSPFTEEDVWERLFS